MSLAEYYFDYKIERITQNDECTEPKLYFERDYKNDSLAYTMFLVPQEWIGKNRVANELGSVTDTERRAVICKDLKYDSVSIVFDMRGIDAIPLLDEKSEGYSRAEKRIECTFDNFYREGCKIVLENDNTQDHSGVGVIEMKKGKTTVARFLFAVNFTFRKKIYYTLNVSANMLSIKYECDACPVGIKTRIVYNQDRLPCLRNDGGTNIVAEHILDFSKGSTYKPEEIRLRDKAKDTKNFFSVVIVDENVSKCYTLECLENSTLKIDSSKLEPMELTYSCPYCHNPIDSDIAKSSHYLKKGGAQCQTRSTAPIQGPVVKGAKKCLYCTSDLSSGMFDPERQRLLPTDFLGHSSFKIGFLGSTRSGKTTYISRFFDIMGTEASMPMTMISNSLKRFGVSVESAHIPKLVKSADIINEYQCSDKSWTSDSVFYTGRTIGYDKYPEATPSGTQTLPYPFITEVNGNTYVSFYDIAGEDAEKETQISKTAAGGVIGVFLLINGNVDPKKNEKIINKLKNSGISKSCPVAVIVTKMDMLENQFDSSCRCLSSDYFDAGKGYEASGLKREIDISSLEIQSLLKRENLEPNLSDKFDHIKYFGISSFNFFDSIHDSGASADAASTGIKFECSSKRMELPFLWMLYQFGIIR